MNNSIYRNAWAAYIGLQELTQQESYAMNDAEQLHAALDEWNAALDGGDIDRLVATADPNIIICNERTPTSVGLTALRNKYAPRIEAFHFKSTVDVHETQIFGDFGVMVLTFKVKTTHKESGEEGYGSGRLILGYRRDAQGNWKIALDVDNNA